MAQVPVRNSDILGSATRRALGRPVDYPKADLASYVQALDNFYRVFAIRGGDHVVMLTDPLLDPRVIQAIQGLAKARGASFAAYMGHSTRYTRVPEEAKALLERADFVVSTWFASVCDPFCIGLRRNKGQRWIKITFFRNWDLLNTPQARFPIDLLGEIIRASARLYPDAGEFDLRFSDERGTNLTIKFTEAMRRHMKADNRWRGHNFGDEEGCYVHYMPTHGPNLYESALLGRDYGQVEMSGVVYPQWAVGFEKPFEEKIGVEFKSDQVVAVHGKSAEAQILREHLVGGVIDELGCGFNPKAPRFDIYPAGPNSPGGLHFGINGLKPSEYLRRVIPDWEEPHIHTDLVTFDSTVAAGNQLVIEEGFLKSLRDPAVVTAAERYGDPIELLESFPV